ncbi:MAG: bifunctional folylpolyglutamate synthase/dihydrofolate synthase, partial [Dehalococcoidales bacterium]|nr:bifunctional folylpolyglutamate synthase/dihydrofolate synthase [Dehalococcoidales bacterium]
MDYQQALDYIDSYTDYEKIPMPHALAYYDLRRVEELLARLGNPHLGARSVHIGGTNGKGSTAAMVASALTVSGYQTGLYSSPHLNTIRERFRVDGVLITEEEFTSIVKGLKPEVQRVNQEGAYGELTTFELLTAVAFTYFKLKGIDFQVLEVGMGGKFDATNVIQPEVSVITSISLDHMEVLGDSLAKIAKEKAGIIKPNGTVVLSPQSDEVVSVIAAVCRDQKVELVMVGKDITWQGLGFDGKKQMLRVKGRLDSYELAIPLLGRYQLENAATAVAALEVLSAKGFSLSRDSITSGLAETSWAGRFQILNRQPLLVVDGAHNPDAARRLKQSLKEYFDFKQSILVMGASADKDVAGVVSELAPAFDRVIVTRSG